MLFGLSQWARGLERLGQRRETCFRDLSEARAFGGGALGGGDAAASRVLFGGGIIAIHYEGVDFSGASLTISGADCDGGGITFTGGVWDNRIRSTENGCSTVEHYDVSSPGVFSGAVEATVGTGGNLTTLAGEVSGVLYAGEPLCAGLSLVECYAPQVVFHPDEDFFPMDPNDFVAGSELRWVANGGCLDRTVVADPQLTELGSGLYEARQVSSVLCRGEDRAVRSSEFTRPHAPEPANLAFNRALLSDGEPLEVAEGFALRWKDYVLGSIGGN